MGLSMDHFLRINDVPMTSTKPPAEPKPASTPAFYAAVDANIRAERQERSVDHTTTTTANLARQADFAAGADASIASDRREMATAQEEKRQELQAQTDFAASADASTAADRREMAEYRDFRAAVDFAADADASIADDRRQMAEHRQLREDAEFAARADASIAADLRARSSNITGFGDPGETFTHRPSGKFEAGDNGRDVIIQGLVDTADPQRIQEDEFQVVELENGNYVVVLAGVVGLKEGPFAGLNEHNQTVRNTGYAADSFQGRADISDNNYAMMVRNYILDNLPQGANVMLVGHSYGADTALDLAADPTFNNTEIGVNVTHVAAAAYHGEPQLASIQNSTEVLLFNNNKDIVAGLEGSGDFLIEGEGLPIITDTIREGYHDYIDPTYNPRDGQVVSNFVGGFSGVGHRQDNYVRHIQNVDDPATDAFFDSVADGGYTGLGRTRAVDISVDPQSREARIVAAEAQVAAAEEEREQAFFEYTDPEALQEAQETSDTSRYDSFVDAEEALKEAEEYLASVDAESERSDPFGKLALEDDRASVLAGAEATYQQAEAELDDAQSRYAQLANDPHADANDIDAALDRFITAAENRDERKADLDRIISVIG